MTGNEMDETTGKGREAPASARPAVPYWEDPVYRYVSRRHKSAAGAEEGPEAERFDGLMQQLVNESMPDETYWQLDEEAKEDRRKQKQKRKRQKGPQPARDSAADRPPSVNVADLKKRIFNPIVSRDNVIKALEALPPGERKSTIAGLPPGLRRKLGNYLKEGGR